MIAKSDLLILVVSASALAFGVYRWQVNTQPATVASAPVPTVTTAAAPADVPQARVIGQLDSAATDNTAFQPTVIEVPANAVGEPIVVENSGRIASDAQPLVSIYRVQYGDYLGRIAQQFNTDIATLRELNGISGSSIRTGQELRVPQVAAN